MQGRSRWAGLAVAALLAGCASDGVQAPVGAAAGNARVVNGPAAGALRFDSETGTCAAGAVQLVSKEQYGLLTRDWTLGDDCKAARKKALPGQTVYPLADGRMAAGSAHVLVRLEADGRLESVRALCASSPGFADAAELTVAAMEFHPAMCGATPVRTAFMLPLDFSPD